MAVEKGDWVKVGPFAGEVLDIKGGRVEVQTVAGKVTTDVKNARIVTRPQTGQGSR